MAMNIDSDYIQQMSMQLASYQVQGALTRLERNEANYKSQLDALSKLRSSLSSFRSAANGLKTGGSRMLVNSASFSQEGYASATVGVNAATGRYQFHVEQLASAHQIALKSSILEEAAEGETLAIVLGEGEGEKKLDIALEAGFYEEGQLNLQSLATAINEHDIGIKAAVMRSGTEVFLLLSSEETGAANRISLELAGNDLESRWSELSKGEDARVHVGSKGSGIELTSSSNRFDNIIDGVSLTFNKAHADGETPLVVDIGRDEVATKGKVQSFVDAFNTLMSSFDSLTASGGENGPRGPLAGDASVRSIDSQMNRLLRTEFGGASLAAYGIVADRNGKLTIDSARFEAAVARDPQGLEQLFSGKDNLLDSIDKTLSSYTSSANGMLTNRMDSLNQSMRRLDQQFETIQRQYDTYYARYLRQFTTMMQTMQAMQQTHGMFG